jgi:hypothetical protein
MVSPVSTSSSEGTSSEGGSPRGLDPIGRPLRPPVYTSVGESSVLTRVKEFLPLFRAAPLMRADPCMDGVGKSSPLIELRGTGSDSEPSSPSGSVGVEIDVGLGVFDVNGEVDEDCLKSQGVEILSSVTPHIGEKAHISSPHEPLIREMD